MDSITLHNQLNASPWRQLETAQSTARLLAQQMAMLDRLQWVGACLLGYGSQGVRPDPGFVALGHAVAPGLRLGCSLVEDQYRGTVEQPGIIFNAESDPRGQLQGHLLRAEPHQRSATLDALAHRELNGRGYFPVITPVRCPALPRGEGLAIVLVVNPRHPAVVNWSPRRKARRIAAASGQAGSNLAYYRETRRWRQRAYGQLDGVFAQIDAVLAQEGLLGGP